MNTILVAAPADVLAWDGDRLLLTDAAVNGQARRPRLSPSVAKSMRSCPARYAGERVLSLRGEPEDPYAPAAVGTAAHTVMERLMGLARTKRTPLAARRLMYELMLELSAPDPDKRWPGLETPRLPQWLALVDSAFMGLFGIVDPRSVTVHRTELRLDDVSIGDVPFKGFVDLVTRCDSGGEDESGFGIVDFKTAKRLPYTPYGEVNDHHDQIRLYRIGVGHKLGDDARFTGSVYYTRDRLARAVPVPMRQPDLAATTRRFATAWRRMNRCADASAWPAKATPLCGWCPLVGTCPAAAADGRTARVEGLPTAVDLPIPVRRAAATVLTLPGRSSGGRGSGAAHDSGEPGGTPGPAAGTGTETGMARLLYEDKAFLEVAENRDTLNPNSYAAMSVFGTVSLAVEELARAGLPLTGARVRGLTRLFASIVAQVQCDHTGSTGWQQGMNTRVRGALRTTVQSLPVPLTGTAEDLRAWHEAARRRVAAITRFSVELWDEGEPTFDGDYAAIVAG